MCSTFFVAKNRLEFSHKDIIKWNTLDVMCGHSVAWKSIMTAIIQNCLAKYGFSTAWWMPAMITKTAKWVELQDHTDCPHIFSGFLYVNNSVPATSDQPKFGQLRPRVCTHDRKKRREYGGNTATFSLTSSQSCSNSIVSARFSKLSEWHKKQACKTCGGPDCMLVILLFVAVLSVQINNKQKTLLLCQWITR
jgi:hypothetical protein